ncbi:COX15/CtaA family protein [Halopseudomonas salegens]|uniref:Cytochrome c oxidase assembly protein subunit 15 n=1 Tax=Halopseudomonas salegens TaxID=1434072 RepID=A0A1H2HZF7_9GAMM|nr:COX15/CtaA family protein [Halopseudomonas salegens]SDU37203.1 cytochrome c oxidase assembly protein subunit 15 [Halopseudomonas salegens]
MRKPGFWLALCALGLGFVVVILGAYTRLVHAGLGCPDWPGCYGFLSVPRSETGLEMAQLRFPDEPLEMFKAWVEMIHRYVAGVLGLMILGLAVYSLRQRKQPGYPVLLCFGLLLMVTAQAIFGMWTVTLKLWPQVVTGHLLGGFATLSLLTLLCLRLSGKFPALSGQRVARLRKLAWVVLAIVITQITLGGWTSTNYAAVACVDFPTCHGEWWPETDFATGFNVMQEIGPNYLGGQMDGPARTAIHMTHRIGALVTLFAVLLLAGQLLSLGLVRLAGLLALALAVQVALGITNVLAHLPLAVAVAHNAFGAVLLLVMVTVVYRLRSDRHSRVFSRSADGLGLASH